MPSQQQQQQQHHQPRQDRFSSAIHSASKGLLLGTAFGDAFGIPIECKTFSELQLLRKCWIDQVLHEHPELLPFHRKLASRAPSLHNNNNNNSQEQQGSPQKNNNNVLNSSTNCDEDDSGQNNNNNNSSMMMMSRQNTLYGNGMDQKTTSDDAGNNNNKQNTSSSSFGPGGGGSTEDIPTPKNQPLSLSQGSHSNNNNDDEGNSNGDFSTNHQQVPARDKFKLSPLDFAETIGHPFITQAEHFQPGMWTDDTQLTLAVVRAIANSIVPGGSDGQRHHQNSSRNDDADDGFLMQRVASMVSEMNENNKKGANASGNNTNKTASSTTALALASQRRALRRARIFDEDDDERIFDEEQQQQNQNHQMFPGNLDDSLSSIINNNNNNNLGIPDKDDDNIANASPSNDVNSFFSKNSSNSGNNNNTISPTSLSNSTNNQNGGSGKNSTINNTNVAAEAAIPSNSANHHHHSSSPSDKNANSSPTSSLFYLNSGTDGNLVCKNPEGLLAKRLQFYHLAQEHVIEHQRTLVGWGGTRTAVARLIRPVEETREALSRADAEISRKAILQRFNAHLSSGNEKATGNGVLMKMTPLSLVLGLEQALVRRAQSMLSREDKKLQQRNRIGAREKLIVELTRMTHGSGDAIATALVHNEMLCSLFEDFFVSCVFTKSLDSSTSPKNASSSKKKTSNTKTNNKPSPSSPNVKSNGNDDDDEDSEDALLQDDASCNHINNIKNNNNSNSTDQDEENLAEDNNTNNNNSERNHNNNNPPRINPGSPLFDRVKSSSKRAALVAAMFQVAIDRGISFCEELSVGDVLPGDSNNNSIPEDSALQKPPSSSVSSTRDPSKLSSPISNSNSENIPLCSQPEIKDDKKSEGGDGNKSLSINFPESFAKIGAALKKVKTFFSDLIRRHHDLSEEAWLQGDVFPFISKNEREEIEKTIVNISNGGTFYCINSVIFVWAYCACFGPCCAVNCARPDIVPVAIAHSALLGGDTDSNAAMIGGIFGVIFGERSIMPHVHNLQQTEMLEEGTKCLECSLNALLSGKLS